jgi:hypothetical protein
VLFFFPFRLSSQSGLYYNQPLVVASGEQIAPILVSDYQAGTFAIWQDKRDGRLALYAQYLNSSGQPQWKQDGIAIATSSKDQASPAAISDGRGGVLIFWQDQRNDDGDIFGQRLDGEGHLLWGASGAPVIRANAKQAEPRAVHDGQGGAFVLCRDFRSGNEDVVAQRIDSNGKVFFDAVGKALAQGNGNQVLGDIAATPDGGFVAAWSDNLTGVPRVLTQRYNDKANPQWPTNVFVVSVRSTQTAPKLFMTTSANDTRGNAYVVWVDSRNRDLDLYAQKIDANGLPQWNLLGVTICKATNDQYSQKIVSDGGDGILLVWEDKRSGKADIYGQALNAAGQARWDNDGVVIAAASQEQTQPSLIADGNGGLICVWGDDRGTGTNILGQHLDKNGKALWTANGIFVTNESGSKQRPAIVALSGNSLGAACLVAWDDTRRGNADIFVQALKNDGTFANVPPRIASSPVTEAREGNLYNYSVQATDYDSADPLRLELAMPAQESWLQADQAKLKLFGTPTINDIGELAVTLMVKDKLGSQATQSFTIKVAANNRPPQIISKPDTVATEDQLYSYKVVATDPDPGETLTLALETDATWLKLTSDSQITGTPANEHVGNYTTTVRATDARGAVATQKFPLRVNNVNDPPFFTSTPDTNAYVDSLYVYRATAADVDRGDVVEILKEAAPEWLSWEASTRTLQGKPAAQHLGMVSRVRLSARDAAGAATEQAFHVRVSAIAAPDIVAPAAPQAAQIQPAVWSAAKKFTLRWQNPFDPSGISGAFYKIGAPPAHGRDGVFVPNPVGTTIEQLELTATQEGKWPVYLWLMDGRNNVDHRTAVHLTYHYDVTPPILSHTATDTAAALTALTISTQARDAISGVREAQLYYRAAGEHAYRAKTFQLVNAQPAGFSTFLARLDAAEVAAKGLEYYLAAADSAGNRARWPVDAPRAIVVASPQVFAPAPLAADRYQIFSIPYRLRDGSPAAVLEDDLGSYDPSVWRLFRYQPGEGNVEFGKPSFESFLPGRAYWMITAMAKNYGAGAAHSINTSTTFALTLQPGWNLIATPFDFPTAWSAVQRPGGVENNLWAFDGTGYLSQPEVLQPWQGYFLRNLDSSSKTILIAPIAAGNNAAKPQLADAEIFWQVRLRVTDGKFRDEENYLGATATAAATWDPYDLSEPPAIGDYVSLYFDRRDWPRYAGAFTSDFRPAAEAAQKWDFTVVATRTGLPVELTWEFSGELREDWSFVLEDVDGRRRRRIQPGKTATEGERYIFFATPQARRFIWWAGREEQLFEAGALKNIIPAAFVLAPSYPNPLRLTGSNAGRACGTIRFGLPVSTIVRLTIFDLAGRAVRALIAGQSLDAGYHEVRWDGSDDRGRSAAAGTYVYRLETANFVTSRKLILLR